MKNKKITFMKVSIVSLEKKIFTGYSDFIVIPCKLGEIGILPNHISFISFITIGAIRIKIYNKNYNEFIFVYGGFVEVKFNNVNILVDTAVRNAHLDKNRSIFSKNFSNNIKYKNKLSLIQAQLMIAISRLLIIKKFQN